MRLIRTVTCFSWMLSASAVMFVSAQTSTATAVSLTSPRFAAALKARNVELLTYRDLIAREGLKSMRRPVD